MKLGGKILNVSYGKHHVGRLALVKGRIAFQYSPDFIKTKLQLSPLELPLKAGTSVVKDNIFAGLFGVFNDSLPDGWTQLLLNRKLRRQGILPQRLTPLDRLGYFGKHGMGALRYTPSLEVAGEIDKNALDIDKLAADSAKVLGNPDEVFTELLSLAGSSGGARPKILVGFSDDYKKVIHGVQNVPKNYSHWIIKFVSSQDSKDSGAIEYAYSLMAKKAGVEMTTTRLLPQKEGAGFFSTKRFDRNGNQPIHMHSLSGLLRLPHDEPSTLDYIEVLRLTLALTKDINEVEKMFRLAVFNVLAHNGDDHAKNFSFVMDAYGVWRVSPAYDLTFSTHSYGERHTTVLGLGKDIGAESLRKLADQFDLKKCANIIEEVQMAIQDWSAIAKAAGVGTISRQLIEKAIVR